MQYSFFLIYNEGLTKQNTSVFSMLLGCFTGSA